MLKVLLCCDSMEWGRWCVKKKKIKLVSVKIFYRNNTLLPVRNRGTRKASVLSVMLVYIPWQQLPITRKLFILRYANLLTSLSIRGSLCCQEDSVAERRRRVWATILALIGNETGIINLNVRTNFNQMFLTIADQLSTFQLVFWLFIIGDELHHPPLILYQL